jgi:hypothetical protein
MMNKIKFYLILQVHSLKAKPVVPLRLANQTSIILDNLYQEKIVLMHHPLALIIEHNLEAEMDCFSSKQIAQQIKF